MPLNASSRISEPRLRLADHVRACQVDGQVILLDLRRSRYAGVGQEQSERLGAVVDGWPATRLQTCRADAAADGLIEPLLAQGLVIRTTEPARCPSTDPIDEATSSLDVRGEFFSSRLSTRQLSRFAAATALGPLRLRWSSLSAIVGLVAARRLRPEATSSVLSERLRQSVATFDRLRPLAFTSKDKCLYDSLALVTYLAYEGLYPHWVIGVKTNPFSAHSWVQAGSLVLNDQHENVRVFRPILVV
jgi:hypothetical protein